MSSVFDKLKEHELVPDLIPSAAENIALLTVEYEDSGTIVNLGEEITATQARKTPKVTWDADPNKLYTLLFVDPDGPSRSDPKRSEFKHGMVVNIPGNDLSRGHVDSAYVGVGAPQGSGLHRYTFLLFEQKGLLPTQPSINEYQLKGRMPFCTKDFAEKNNLGQPVAANFFQAQYDDSVPGLQRTPMAQASPTSDAFSQNQIVPDVLPSLNSQLQEATVTYGQSKVNLGNELTPTQVKNKPQVQWNAQSGKLYSLLMVDPDAPSRANPIRREFKHWAVINIPENHVEKGYELAGYVGAGPPQGTGLHRYVFLVYEQPGKLTEESSVPSTSTKDRAQFKASKWASDNRLIGPVAVNFFQAQYDDYVPKLHASFKS